MLLQIVSAVPYPPVVTCNYGIIENTNDVTTVQETFNFSPTYNANGQVFKIAYTANVAISHLDIQQNTDWTMAVSENQIKSGVTLNTTSLSTVVVTASAVGSHSDMRITITGVQVCDTNSTCFGPTGANEQCSALPSSATTTLTPTNTVAYYLAGNSTTPAMQSQSATTTQAATPAVTTTAGASAIIMTLGLLALSFF
eukprot:NODE_436_length_7460_cov_0.466105.p5 type:complete len:198 gc:universal NODE_436_length_7460_cov_0.466105:4761-4168(-)